MEDMNKNPLEYFQNLLEKDKYDELKNKGISEIIENFGDIEDVDSENGIVTYWNSFYDQRTDDHVEGLVTYDFDKSFNRKINSEFIDAKKLIDSVVLDITYKGINPIEFIDIQILLLKDLIIKTDSIYLERPIVKNAIVALIRYVNDKYLSEKIISINLKSPNQIDSNDYCAYALQWDSLNQEDIIPNIEKLYSFLTIAPAIISSTKANFINAFTMRKVTTGINWLVTHNKSISKSSLFYFIDKLIDEGFINEVPQNILNKKIDYLFRDSFGKKLKNIRQSKHTASSTPASKERIDHIISSIF